jgi:competence protein ComEC
MEIDGVRLEFLSPNSSPVDASVDANDYSAAFRLSYGRFSALFLGDLPVDGERSLVKELGAGLDVDLLKVAHHGSNGSSSTELLVATSPQVALISAGRRNRYRHPGTKTLAQLGAAGIRVFRSDQDGTVSVLVDSHGKMRVSTAQ